MEKILEFPIKDFTYYEQALIHASVSNGKFGNKINNERLEYLGDSVLDLVIADFLYQNYPEKDEGELTKLRSIIVQRTQLNRIAEELGLPQYVKGNFNNSVMPDDVKGNALEALIGAIYLDRGFKVAYEFVKKQIVEKRINLKEIKEDHIDYKSELFIWVQKNKKSLRFETISDNGRGDKKKYIINVHIDGKPLGTGEGNSKKRAQQVACKHASKMLNLKFA